MARPGENLEFHSADGLELDEVESAEGTSSGRGSSLLAKSAVWIMSLTVVYGLSVGPVLYVVDQLGLTTDAHVRTVLQVIYFPLIILHHAVPAFEKVLTWYLDLFGVG